MEDKLSIIDREEKKKHFVNAFIKYYSLTTKLKKMKKYQLSVISSLLFFIVFFFSCQKEKVQEKLKGEEITAPGLASTPESAYNIEVVLKGEGNQNGHIHFRQHPDPAKIITLDTKVHNLKANHPYLLQRAVDVVLDGNCTGTNWLTLGYGLTPQSIMTNFKGDGEEELWRDVSAIPSGTTFDIHFRVIDALNQVIILKSDCYQYTVR